MTADWQHERELLYTENMCCLSWRLTFAPVMTWQPPTLFIHVAVSIYVRNCSRYICYKLSEFFWVYCMYHLSLFHNACMPWAAPNPNTNFFHAGNVIWLLVSHTFFASSFTESLKLSLHKSIFINFPSMTMYTYLDIKTRKKSLTNQWRFPFSIHFIIPEREKDNENTQVANQRRNWMLLWISNTKRCMRKTAAIFSLRSTHQQMKECWGCPQMHELY